MIKYLLPMLLCAGLSAAPLTLEPDTNGFPKGWKTYGKGPGIAKIEKGLLHIADKSDVNEWGISRTFHNPAHGKYEITVEASGNLDGAQMVVLPAGKKISVARFFDTPKGEFEKFTLQMEIPAGCRNYTIYIYGNYQMQADFLIRKIDVAQVKEFSKIKTTKAESSVSPSSPQEIKVLKPLYLTTPLAQAVIAAGNTPALQKAAKALAAATGALIVPAESISLPLTKHVIAIGNRANNPFIDKLYTRGYCYTDLVYPGKGGYELRSIHNVTGKGFNVILCGGSDDAGAVLAAEKLAKAPKTIGNLMDLKVPGFNKAKFNPYDADHYYLVGNGGYYGWNYLSGMLALFYQTGDTFYAREFIRLAFPDAKAKKDFQNFNAESIELPNDPLAGPYHYCAHQMILLWDLVEEHPVFTDAERLAVTNAFARQWKHHVRWTQPVNKRLVATSRHGQWAQISNYALGRYFMRDYPAPAWENAIKRAECDFAIANNSDGWIEGERGIVSWFVSGAINPASQFFAISGGAKFNPDGALANAFRFMQTQWDGSSNSEVFGTAHRQAFYLAAEHTGDGKFIWFADLLKPYDPAKFKLGASYSPTGKIQSRPPTELLNTWTSAPMKKGERNFFRITAPAENCYLGLSWRDSLDTTGDWISFNCFNESYRTPFKLLSLYGLRLNGHKLLAGFGSYVQPTRSGSVAREIPTVGQVYGFGQAGKTVYFSGGVPDHSFSAWQRDLMLRNRTFVLLADTITPSQKSDLPITAMINMQTASGVKLTEDPKQMHFSNARSGKSVSAKDMNPQAIPECNISSGARNTLFETEKIGDRAVLSFVVPRNTVCAPVLALYDHGTRAGTVNIYLDGKKIMSGVPHFADVADISLKNVPLGIHKLAGGRHTLELEVASISKQATNNWIGVGHFILNPDASATPGEQVMAMTASAGEIVLRTGADLAIKRNLPSDPAKPVTTFSLFSFSDLKNPVKAGTYADNAAVFLLPEPMLVFCRELAPFGQGTLVVLEKERISGQGVKQLGNFFSADAPVGMDWIFGRELIVSGKAGTVCTVNSKKYTLNTDGKLQIRNIAPEKTANWQQQVLAAADSVKKNMSSAAAVNRPKPVPAQLEKIADLPDSMLFIRPVQAGFLAGTDDHLLVLDKNYRIRHQLKLNGKVQCAVQAGDLFVAGSKNEEIAAFDAQGRKRWSFTSILAPEVEATQKYYWFKKPYPGLFTLEYRDGRIYAGGACTMEVLDLNGKLLGRYPQTWGPCRQITFLNQADGSYNAIGLRHSSADGVYMWAVNSKTGKNTQNYSTNVYGYRHFPSFGSLYRTQSFAGDFDGNGSNELLTDAQGMYTWLNLYEAGGRPQKQINLGPGKVIRTWAAGDFTGDTRPDAAVSTWGNQLLAIDGNCLPLWTADLPIKGTVVEINSKTREVILSDLRHICVVDNSGKLTAFVRLPETMTQLWVHDGDVYIFSAGKVSRLKF